MVEIPDALRCLFTAEIEQEDRSFLIKVPKEEIDKGDVMLDEMYRVAPFSYRRSVAATN